MRQTILFILAALLTGNVVAQNVGIGTAIPTAMLDVNGSLRIRSGAPAAGKVLTSDANGNTSWTSAVQPGVVMSEDAADANLLANNYTNSASVLLNTKTASNTTANPNAWLKAGTFLEPRIAPTVVSAGSYGFAVFGGYADNTSLSNGAFYNPVTDTWTSIPDIGDGIDRSGPIVVWTGTKLVVWGGYLYNGSVTYYNSGAVYDPVTKTWTTMSTTGAPSGRSGYAYAYNAATNDIAIWGGIGSGSPLADGARYNVGTNSWLTMATLNAPTGRYGMGYTNVNGALWMFGGYTTTQSAQAYNYSFANNTWFAYTAPSLSARTSANVYFVNGKIIVWGGSSASNTNETDGAVYTIANANWVAMGNSGVPNPYGGRTTISNNYLVNVGFNGSAKYDPATNAWSSLQQESRANFGLGGNSTGLFAFGGTTSLSAGSPLLQNGSRFFWTAQSITNHVNGVQELYLYRKN